MRLAQQSADQASQSLAARRAYCSQPNAAAYRESWRRGLSEPEHSWQPVDRHRLRGRPRNGSAPQWGARGSLDGFGQLTALSELHLDSNRFNGKSPSTCLHRILRGWVPAYVLSCRCLPGLHWACAPTTPPAKLKAWYDDNLYRHIIMYYVAPCRINSARCRSHSCNPMLLVHS
jgi:hypothetical protein